MVAGLKDLVAHLQRSGQPARIQLVGGVAIALTVDENRPPTNDVDALISPPDAVRAAAEEVGRVRGWPDGWLDDQASIFLPDQFGRGTEWVTLYEEGGVIVQVATVEMLLAMKLVAVQKRPARDAGDVRLLLSAVGLTSADEAERLLGEFYPGDELTPKAFAIVEELLAAPRTASVPTSPPNPFDKP